nr:unnamed protein product [Callosobruchus analis]
MMGGTLRLKKGVLPHKHIDEPKGKPNEGALTDSAKKRRLEYIDRFQTSLTKRVRLLDEDIPSTSRSVSRHLSTDKCTYPESQLQDTATKSRRSLGLQVHLKGRNVYTQTKFISDSVATPPMKQSKIVTLDVNKSPSVASSQCDSDQDSEYNISTEISTTIFRGTIS